MIYIKYIRKIPFYLYLRLKIPAFIAGFKFQPKNYTFPSNFIHTNDKFTLKKLKYLIRGYDNEIEIQKHIKNIRLHTMVTYDGLLSLYQISKYIIQSNIEGSFVETGVCKGGSSALMALAILDYNSNKNLRHLHLFDSFEGLPNPVAKEYQSWMKTSWGIDEKDADGSLKKSNLLNFLFFVDYLIYCLKVNC